MKPVRLHEQRSVSDVPAAPSSHRLSLFGRTEFRRSIVLLPEMPYPLSRQRRGRWLTADLPPMDAASTGATVVRCGLGSDDLLECLADIASALGPEFHTHEYMLLGTGLCLSDVPVPASALTPASYWLADAQAAMHGRLSILYRQPFLGITHVSPISEAILTVPTACADQIMDSIRLLTPNSIVDSQAYWFVAFMNARSVLGYSVRILPLNSPRVSHEGDQTYALTMAHLVKKELERLQVCNNNVVAVKIG